MSPCDDAAALRMTRAGGSAVASGAPSYHGPAQGSCQRGVPASTSPPLSLRGCIVSSATAADAVRRRACERGTGARCSASLVAAAAAAASRSCAFSARSAVASLRKCSKKRSVCDRTSSTISPGAACADAPRAGVENRAARRPGEGSSASAAADIPPRCAAGGAGAARAASASHSSQMASKELRSEAAAGEADAAARLQAPPDAVTMAPAPQQQQRRARAVDSPAPLMCRTASARRSCARRPCVARPREGVLRRRDQRSPPPRAERRTAQRGHQAAWLPYDWQRRRRAARADTPRAEQQRAEHGIARQQPAAKHAAMRWRDSTPRLARAMAWRCAQQRSAARVAPGAPRLRHVTRPRSTLRAALRSQPAPRPLALCPAAARSWRCRLRRR